MIKLALAAENMPYSSSALYLGIAVAGKEYIHAEDAVRYFRVLRPGTLYWACAEDIAQTVQHWRNRECLEVTTIVVPIEIVTHSTLVRRGELPPHPAIVIFMEEHRLYPEDKL